MKILLFAGLLLFVSVPINAALPAQVSYGVRFLFSIKPPSVEGTELSEPAALAVDQQGNIYVVDTGNSRILKLDPSGEYIAGIGAFGWESEEFDRPLDISAKSGLDLFVADYNNIRIERYDRELNHIASLLSDDSRTANLRFGFPISVDFSKHGELFVCDNEHDRILKFDSDGVPVLSFGDFNWGEGQLRNPVKIEVTGQDLIYVSDQGSNDIVMFDYYGSYLSRFGRSLLQQPAGLAWSAATETLYVVDTGNHRIAVFDSRQDLVFAWGTEGDRIGAFKKPVDVAVLDHKIYVLDASENHIQVFQLLTR